MSSTGTAIASHATAVTAPAARIRIGAALAFADHATRSRMSRTTTPTTKMAGHARPSAVAATAARSDA